MISSEQRKQAALPWFRFALVDIRAAKYLLTGKPDFIRKICFDCQQAVEKSLKGFLIYHGNKITKTHNLRELSEQVLKIDSTMNEFLATAVELGPYAVAYRYPDASLKEPTINDAQEAIRIADKIFKEITTRIPFETGFPL